MDNILYVSANPGTLGCCYIDHAAMNSLGNAPTLLGSGCRTVAAAIGIAVAPFAAYKLCKLLYASWGILEDSTVHRHVVSLVASKFTTKLDPGIRCDFVHLYRQSGFSVPASHSHGEEATHRNEALRSMQNFAHASGFEPYSVSASSRETDAGYHSWWLAKDVAHAPRWSRLEEKHMLLFCDSDYYCDMKSWLAKGNPAVLYTFAPTTVVGNEGNTAYTIDRDNYVAVAVGGGATYYHQIWDYDTDVIVLDFWTYTLVYSVEFRQLPSNHRVVLLTPIAKIWAPFGWFLPGLRLRRKVYCDGFALANIYQNEKGVMASVARLGAAASVDMPLAELQAIAIRFFTSKKPQVWDIETFLRKAGHDAKSQVTAPLLFDYLGSARPSFLSWSAATAAPLRRDEPQRPANYQAIAEADSQYIERGRLISDQLVRHPDVVPCLSEANDIACVVGRIHNVFNSKTPPNMYDRGVQEFARRLIPESHIGIPWDANQVAELWTLPLQRARVEKAANWMFFDPQVTIRAFIKAETYANLTDPRNISTFPARHNLELARYTYAFKHGVLKKTKWYGPGMTPRLIAERVADIASGTAAVCESDFSRLDGTKSKWLRMQFERTLYTRYFGGDARREVGLRLDAEVGAMGYTSSGTAYDPMGTLGSGSSLTTDTNTADNAFVTFMALYLMFHDWQVAWDLLGVYVGDDGLSEVAARALEEAATDMGLRLKAVVKTARNGDPVCFLNRVFPDAWSGSTSSFGDPLRALRKIHISFAPKSVEVRQALANKCHGYLTLDPTANGIVSLWCRNQLRATGLKGEVTVEDSPYWLWANLDENFETWPQAEPVQSDIYLAQQLGDGGQSVLALREHLETGAVLIPEELRLPNPQPEEKIPAIVTQDVWATLPDWAKRFTRWSPVVRRKPGSLAPTEVGETPSMPSNRSTTARKSRAQGRNAARSRRSDEWKQSSARVKTKRN